MVSFCAVTPFSAELGEGKFYSKGKLLLLLWVINIFIFICSVGTIIIVPNKSSMDYGHESPEFLVHSGPVHLIDYREKNEDRGSRERVKEWKVVRKYVVHLWKLFAPARADTAW